MRACGLEDDRPCARYCGERPGLCDITWHLWPDDSDAVAVVMADDRGGGWCWVNMACVTTEVRPLVRAWATNAVYRGVPIRTLNRDQLRRLAGATVGSGS